MSCFVNNYLEDGIMAWQANLNIQPAPDYYKVISYI